MKTPNPQIRPDIDRYTSYRAWLLDLIEHLRATRRSWSFASFSKSAGFRSRSTLKLIADGHRNLTARSLPKVMDGLDLDPHERAVFPVLVALEQADDDAERRRQLASLRRLTRPDSRVRVQARHYDVWSRWYAIVIRELAQMHGFRDDPAWLGRRLRPKVRPETVEVALRKLEAAGLMKPGEDGRLVAASETIATDAEVRSLAIRDFHRAMLRLTGEALDEVPQDERNVTGLTLPLSREQYEETVARLAELRRELLARWEADKDAGAGKPRDVYHLTLALVPVTQQTSEDEEGL